MDHETRGARYGGFQDVADALSTPDHVVSRQQVYAWWTRRGRNGFPDRIMHEGHLDFPINEVEEWYATYIPSSGGRPHKRRD